MSLQPTGENLPIKKHEISKNPKKLTEKKMSPENVTEKKKVKDIKKETLVEKSIRAQIEVKEEVLKKPKRKTSLDIIFSRFSYSAPKIVKKEKNPRQVKMWSLHFLRKT